MQVLIAAANEERDRAILFLHELSHGDLSCDCSMNLEREKEDLLLNVPFEKPNIELPGFFDQVASDRNTKIVYVADPENPLFEEAVPRRRMSESGIQTIPNYISKQDSMILGAGGICAPTIQEPIEAFEAIKLLRDAKCLEDERNKASTHVDGRSQEVSSTPVGPAVYENTIISADEESSIFELELIDHTASYCNSPSIAYEASAAIDLSEVTTNVVSVFTEEKLGDLGSESKKDVSAETDSYFSKINWDRVNEKTLIRHLLEKMGVSAKSGEHGRRFLSELKEYLTT